MFLSLTKWSWFDLLYIAIIIYILVTEAMALRMAHMAKDQNLPGIDQKLVKYLFIKSIVIVVLASLGVLFYIYKGVEYFTRDENRTILSRDDALKSLYKAPEVPPRPKLPLSPQSISKLSPESSSEESSSESKQSPSSKLSRNQRKRAARAARAAKK